MLGPAGRRDPGLLDEPERRQHAPFEVEAWLRLAYAQAAATVLERTERLAAGSPLSAAVVAQPGEAHRVLVAALLGSRPL